MKKDALGTLLYLALFFLAVLLIVNYCFATRDVSWIDDVETFIQKDNWEPDKEFAPLADWAFFLYENGTEQFFYLDSQQEFVGYLNGLMNSVDKQVEESISEEFLDELLAGDKVLAVVHRFSTKSQMWTPPNSFGAKVNYNTLFFVLNDNLGTGLQGTIVVREPLEASGSSYRYSVWQMSQGGLW